MVIINHYISDKKIELELRVSFQEREAFNKQHYAMLSHSFKWNKVRRTYHKVYYLESMTLAEAEDFFNRDIAVIHETYPHYQHNVYKLLRTEKNT